MVNYNNKNNNSNNKEEGDHVCVYMKLKADAVCACVHMLNVYVSQVYVIQNLNGLRSQVELDFVSPSSSSSVS